MVDTRVDQLKLGTTVRAGNRLRVVAPVRGVGVFALTLVAHAEMAHRCARPVVRERLDDGVARAALGAVNEGVAVSPVVRVAQLSATGRAGGEVGEDVNWRITIGDWRSARGLDGEGVVSSRAYVRDAEVRGLCQRRRVLSQLSEEPTGVSALGEHDNSLAGVGDVALDAKCVC